jgi:1,4-alpha-glucan branching enzyme
VVTKRNDKVNAAKKRPMTATSVSTKPKRPAATDARKTVTFKIHAPEARTVDIAASINNWILKPMKRGKDGIWMTSFRPPPGIYEYKFLIDHHWVDDPNNHDKISDGHGGVNSVCRAGM